MFICVKANKIRKCLAGLIKQQKKSSQNVMNERQHKILERMISKIKDSNKQLETQIKYTNCKNI